MKEAENGHKDLVGDKQLQHAQVNSQLEVVAKQQNKSRMLQHEHLWLLCTHYKAYGVNCGTFD